MFLFCLSGAFKLYDIDKDGHISREEMTEIISAIVEMVGPNHGLSTLSAKSKANQIFDSMDCVSDMTAVLCMPNDVFMQ